MATKELLVTATGRRKESIARVRLKPGTGEFSVNDRTLDDYFGRATSKMLLKQPLEVVEQLNKVDIYKTSFRPMKMSLAGRDTRAFFKLVVDGTTDRVVGCHIVGDTAAEIIQAVAIAVKMKATKADFDATLALHPTAAEELVTMRTPTARHVRQAAE